MFGVSQRVIHAIGAEQPYVGRNEDDAKASHFAVLTQANNADKHRGLTSHYYLVFDTPEPVNIRTAVPGIDVPIEPLVAAKSRLVNGTAIYRVKVVHAAGNVDMKITLPFDVFFE